MLAVVEFRSMQRSNWLQPAVMVGYTFDSNDGVANDGSSNSTPPLVVVHSEMNNYGIL